MHILVLNPGSSTLKYRVYDMVLPSAPLVLLSDTIDHLTPDTLPTAAADVLARTPNLDAIGCRVVHGGDRFSDPTRVTPDVLQAIRELGRLAPLHNPPAAAVLTRLTQLLPNVPIVAVFDTAFHRTLPDVAALYALPLNLACEKGLRRYGFHGISHRYVADRLHQRTAGKRLITCHLGNGASITAIRDGKSIDTSMGLTPLEGLVMGTRCGDVDPGLLLHLLREEKLSLDEVDRLLNKESGLLGVGGHADLRDLQQANDDRARLAMDLFAYRVRKYVGAYAAALEGVDALAFTGGIGEHSAPMRERICTPLHWLGVQFDSARNAQPGPGEVCLTTPASHVQVWVIPTDEEGLIAQDTARVVNNK